MMKYIMKNIDNPYMIKQEGQNPQPDCPICQLLNHASYLFPMITVFCIGLVWIIV